MIAVKAVRASRRSLTVMLVGARLLVVLSLAVWHAAPAPAQAWRQYASPAEAGWSAEGLTAARTLADRIGSAAVFVVFRGHVLAAWGEVERRFETHSVRKSVLGALVGIRVTDGSIDLDARVGDLGIDDEPPLTEAEKGARVRDLLMARSGVYHAAAKEPADMRRERPARGSAQPGERFVYNNWDFNVVGVVLARATGHSVAEELADHLAKPLGMEDWRPGDAILQLEPSSSLHPAYAIRLSARDLARFGWLYARGGRWGKAQVVPAAWVAASTQPHSDAGRGRAYGYMWWVYPRGSFGAGTELPVLDGCDKFAAIGTGGQLVLVVPSAELVIVHRGDTDNDREVRGGDVWRLAEKIAASRAGEAAAAPKLMDVTVERLTNVQPEPPEATAIPIAPEALNDYVGEFASGPSVRGRVHRWEDRLFLVVAGQGEFELLAAAKDTFFGHGMRFTVRFERDAEGKVEAATMERAGGKVRVVRQR